MNLPFRSLAIAALLAVAATASAHCDGEDGPVVTAAREALASGAVEPVLAWVQAKDETEIRAAFTHALAVRALSPEARSLADRFFFETLVRVHRAGEGAAYDGLKPAGRDLGPAVPAADRAIASGRIDAVQALLAKAVAAGLHARFHAVVEARDRAPADVAAGRRYVAAYVAFVHYVEGLHQAAAAAGGHHEPAADAPPVHHQH